MTTEKKRKFIINFVYLLILIAIIYFIFKYAINILMPFFIAYIVASMLRPLVEVLCRRIKINRKIVSFIIVLIFYAIVAVIIVLIAARVISITKTQVERLPALYKDNIQPALVELFDGLSKLPDDIDPSIAEVLSSVTDNLISYAGKLFSKVSDVIVGAISGFAYSIPTLVVGTIFCIIASYYIIVDHGLIGDFMDFTGGNPPLSPNFKLSMKKGFSLIPGGIAVKKDVQSKQVFILRIDAISCKTTA